MNESHNMGAGDLQFMTVGKNGAERRIAVIKTPGEAPSLLWLSGFKSDMSGTKAAELARFGRDRGQEVVRFDYSGHGRSGRSFEETCVSDWLEEAEAVFDRCCTGNTILVGSSMGGWIALLLALSRRDTGKIKGLVLIAPAVDFTEDLMWNRCFSDDIRETIFVHGRWEQPSAYSGKPYVITRKLIEDGRKHLLFGKPLRVGAPLAILHGARDEDVPPEHGQRLVEALPADDVTFTLVPDGDHRLSRPQDIELILGTVARMQERAGRETG